MHDFASVVVRCIDFWSVTESVTDEAESEACNPVMREENHLFDGDVSASAEEAVSRCLHLLWTRSFLKGCSSYNGN